MSRSKVFASVRAALPLAALSLWPAAAGAAVLADADFDADAAGFVYQDDAFRGTAQGPYASGTRIATGGRTGGGLQVKVGGVDNVAVTNMSGGWRFAFTLAAAADVKITFAYNLDADAAYEADEYGEVLASLDGVLLGSGGADYIRRIADGGVSGWQTVTVTQAAVAAGGHTVMLGAFSNKKTELAEQTVLTLDDVLIETLAPVPADVYIQDPGADGIVSMEAERFVAKLAQGGKDWNAMSPAGASGTAVQALPNTGTLVNTGYTTASPRLDFKVRFRKTGTHWIWARGMAAGIDDDSYHAGLNGAALASSDRISGFGTGWTWVRADMDGGQANFNVATAAQHVVNAWMREDGLILDKIVLTTSSAYVPTGAGPAESPRTDGNLPPVAEAGPGLFTLAGKPVTLDGSRSADTDGPSPLSFAWTQTAGPAVTLSGANTARPSFTAGAAGAYAFRLTVSDGSASATATVNVKVGGPVPGTLNLAEAVFSHDAANMAHADFPAGLYDNDLSTFGLINYNPSAVNITLAFPKAVSANGMGIVQHQAGWFSLAGANSLADLDARTGSYALLLNQVPANPDAWTRSSFPQRTFRYFRVTSQRTAGDGFAHIMELELATADRFQLVPFVQPRGLAVDRYDRKLVADAGAGRVFALDASGACAGEMGAGNLVSPYDVALDDQGNILVADFGGNRIQKFSPTGDFLSTFVGAGTVRGRVTTPTGIAVDAQKRVWVSEASTHRVQRFLASGALDASFGIGGAIGTDTNAASDDHFDLAADVAWDATRRQVAVADRMSTGPAGHSRIRIFNEAGVLQRTVQGLYQVESLARDAAGTIYAVGGVTAHNNTMGALRLVGPDDEFAVNVWRNGTAWPGKVCAGVVLDNQGRVVFSDMGRRRLHVYEPGKQGDIYAVNVRSGPSWIEVSWKTHAACPTRVLWGRSAPTTEAGDAVATKDHVWRVEGLLPSTRYVIAPLYPRAMDGAMVASRTEAAATEPAAAGRINVLKVRTAGLIYTHGMTPADIQKIKNIYTATRQFYFRNGHGRFWMDMPYIEVARALSPAEMDPYGPSPATVEADLRARGYSASNPVDLVVICYRDHPKGNWGGGATLFGRNVGISRFTTESPFVVLHEVNHAIDAMFSANGMEKYDHNHGLWNVEFGINGGDGTLNGEIMRRVSPANILALSATHGVLTEAADADGDGLSESTFLPVNEATLGSSGSDIDSDDDGLTDLQEMMGGIHHPTNAKARDADGDSATQGNDRQDRNPLLDINGYVAKGTPSLDGIFSPSEGWTLVSNGNNFRSDFEMGSTWNPTDAQQHPATRIWSAWDANAVYFALEFTKRPGFMDRVHFRTDNNGDGWYNGLDNHNLQFDDWGLQSNRIHGITQDISNLLGDGGWGEINDDDGGWFNSLGYAPLFNHGDVRFQLRALGGDRYYVEFRLPAGARRNFRPAAGKTLSFRVSHETEWNHWDTLMELDAGARLMLVDPLDSDGDGVYDQQEIDIGRNPNVPG